MLTTATGLCLPLWAAFGCTKLPFPATGAVPPWLLLPALVTRGCWSSRLTWGTFWGLTAAVLVLSGASAAHSQGFPAECFPPEQR